MKENSLNHYLQAWNLSDPQPLTETPTSHLYIVTRAGERVVLKLQGGKVEAIPHDQIEEMKVSPLSLMPEGLENQLKPAEIDLLKKWIGNGAAWDQEALAKASGPRDVKLSPIPANVHPVYAVAVTADGSHLAIGRGTHIQIFDLTSTNTVPIADWPAHGEFVRALAWSADGKHLASSSFREVATW